MLRQAIEARVPLIAARTSETVYAAAMVAHIAGREVVECQRDTLPATGKDDEVKANTVFVLVSADGEGLRNANLAYRAFWRFGSSLVLFNAKDAHPAFLNMGDVEPPPAFVASMLRGAKFEKGAVASVMPAMGGLTAQDAIAVARMVTIDGAPLIADAVLDVRRRLVPPPAGVEFVATDVPGYRPENVLVHMAETERQFFLMQQGDLRLRPRGVLFSGTPGTGKSAAAKFIARTWGVPLYRMDSTILNKYIGESEARLSAALSMVGRAEPCVLLIDEVEKFFRAGGGGGADPTTRMLGSLLWWLQEHRHRVFTVMTTNDAHALPPELVREGRVDAHVVFSGMALRDARDLATVLLASYMDGAETGRVLRRVFGRLGAELEPIAHATVDAIVRAAVKDDMREGSTMEKEGI